MRTIDNTTQQRSATTYGLIVLIATVYLANIFILYGPTGRDDAFLTYWPAQTLAQHGEILNYNSERVEQSSTLLHTVCLAIAQKIVPGIAMPTLAWALSITAGLFTLLLSALALRKQNVSASSVLVLASAPSILFWASSGMETLSHTFLFTALLVGLQLRSSRTLQMMIVCCSVLTVMVRPETFLVLCIFAALTFTLHTLCNARSHTLDKTLLVIIGSATAAFICISLWRHANFGAWFPQPVTAKSAPFNAATFFKGFFYITSAEKYFSTALITAGGLLSFFAALFLKTHAYRNAIINAGCLVLTQIAFILTTGGDWMEATRFITPILPASCIALALFLSHWRMLHTLAFSILIPLALYDTWHFVKTESTGFPLWERTTAPLGYLPNATQQTHYSSTELQTKDALRDVPQLEQLKDIITQLHGIPGPINIASIQMGFIPYHLSTLFPRQLHFLDFRALSTSQLTECPLTQQFPHSDTGLKISYDDFFALLPQLTSQCGIQKPDIIYDMGYAMRKDVLRNNGYRFVYREARAVHGTFSARGIGSELFIAVRSELVDRYQLHDLDQPTVNSAQPNIVLMIADDISYDEFGFMGNTSAHTPTLDQLAQQGTVFTTAYDPVAFCRPSLATLLTGQWPHQTRLHANNGVIALPAGYETLAATLQQHGFATFAGGKFWEDEPNLRGFTAFDTDKNQFARQDQNKLWAFLDSYAGKQPFFIWWAPMLPHTPHNPPQAFLDAINPASIVVPAEIPAESRAEFIAREHNFLAMGLWLDTEAGKLYQQLKDRNQLDNTLIVFLSDNGFSHKSYSKSFPHELGLRTPIIFNWPGKIPGGRRIDATINTVDLYPTLLNFAGVDNLKPSSTENPGVNLRATLENKQVPVAEKIFGADYQAVTRKTDPLPRPERDIFALHVRDGDWKYVFFLRDLHEEENADLTIKSGMSAFPVRRAGDEELYNLATDAYEQHNLASAAQAERLHDYRQQALHWWYSTGGKAFDAIKDCPREPAALCEKLRP